MFKKFLITLSTLVFAVATALAVSNPASAATPFDNTVKTIDDLIINSTEANDCNAERSIYDWTNSWSEIFDYQKDYPDITSGGWSLNAAGITTTELNYVINSGSASYLDSAKDFWENEKEHWGITRQGENNFQLWFTDDPNASGYFHQYEDPNYKELRIDTHGYRLVVLSLSLTTQFAKPDSSLGCSLTVNINADWPTGAPYTISGNYYEGKQGILFAFLDSIDYPTDYEGEEVPDTVPTEAVPLDYWINFNYSNSTQYVTSSYLNKQTDPASSLSDPFYIHWKLWVNGTSVTEGGDVVCESVKKRSDVFNSALDCTYNGFQVESGKQYYLSAEINPFDGNNEDILVDEYLITFKRTFYKIDFSTASAGSTVQCEGGALGANMSVFCLTPQKFNALDCFQTDFPFVDVPSCTDTFNVFFTNLFFGGFAFPELNYDPACRSLDTFDNWLSLPAGYMVCPQFPSSVRTVVTPFVAFMLGIVTLGFIKRRTGDFNG